MVRRMICYFGRAGRQYLSKYTSYWEVLQNRPLYSVCVLSFHWTVHGRVLFHVAAINPDQRFLLLVLLYAFASPTHSLRHMHVVGASPPTHWLFCGGWVSCLLDPTRNRPSILEVRCLHARLTAPASSGFIYLWYWCISCCFFQTGNLWYAMSGLP